MLPLLSREGEGGGDGSAVEWVEGKYRQAYGLRASLRQRRELMLSIAEQLVARQKAFFAFGPRHRREVTMGQVAEDLSVSVSTVSRAVKGSFVQCRWGVVPMKSLFSHSTIARPPAGGNLRMMLRDIVEGEDRSCPLSDQKIAEEFARRGVELVAQDGRPVPAGTGHSSCFRAALPLSVGALGEGASSWRPSKGDAIVVARAR